MAQPSSSDPLGPAPRELPGAAQQQLSQATQALVDSSNRALRQSSEKLAQLENELGELRRRLESVSTDLAAEREQRIAAEAQLAAQMAAVRVEAPAAVAAVPLSELEASLSRPADLLREAGERQLELVKRLERVMQAGKPLQPAVPSPARWLSTLGGGAIGGAVVLLGLRAVAPNLSLTGVASPPIAEIAGTPTAQSSKSGTPDQDQAASPGSDTLHLRCDRPCWLDVRELPGNRSVVSKNLKGSLSLPIGTGLDVFSGRGDLLKVRVNDEPEAPFSTRVVGKRQFLPTGN